MLANEERFLEVAENSAIDVLVAATKENLALVAELSGEDAGTGTGLANTIWQTAGIISPVTFAWLLESTGAYRMSWQMLASTVLLAALFYAQVRERMSKI